TPPVYSNNDILEENPFVCDDGEWVVNGPFVIEEGEALELPPLTVVVVRENLTVIGSIEMQVGESGKYGEIRVEGCAQVSGKLVVRLSAAENHFSGGSWRAEDMMSYPCFDGEF